MTATIDRDWEVLSNLPEDRRRVRVPREDALVAEVVERGYVVRERLIDGAMLEELRAATDALEAICPYQPNTTGSFGGLFIRGIIDRHPAFLALARWEPLLSLSRALLGPQVQVVGNVMRVSYPDLPAQDAEWHFHLRLVPNPLPPFFMRPHAIDHLIYLDGLDADTGPLAVVPGSHRRDERLPRGDLADKPDQVVLTCPAGSVISAHASLWHRAFAPRSGTRKRRMLIIGHGPLWMRPYDRVGGGCAEAWTASRDRELRELSGVAYLED